MPEPYLSRDQLAEYVGKRVRVDTDRGPHWGLLGNIYSNLDGSMSGDLGMERRIDLSRVTAIREAEKGES
jgi:hypothetical protein